MDKLESLIEEEQKRIDEINGGANTKRLAELNDLKREHSEAKAAIQEHAEKLPQLQNAQKAAQEGPKKHEQLKEKKKSELTQAQDSLKQLRTDQGSQKQGYPAGMDRLIKAIHQDQSFQENPLGPIGNHVFLEKVLWSSILERSLGGTLNSFIVTSKRDQGILSGIMKRVNW